MSNRKVVVLATDYTKATKHALEHASLGAALTGAELHLVHVAVLLKDDANDPERQLPGEELYQKALDELAAKRVEAIEPPPQPAKVIKTTLRGIEPTELVADYAAEVKADLLILGTHARRGIRRWLMGSVAEDIVRSADMTTLVVGSGQGHEPRGERYKTVICATDFSDTAKLALREAGAVAAANGARLMLVHVIDQVPHPAYYLFGHDSVLELFPDLVKRSRAHMEELVAECVPEGTETELVVAEGTVHHKIAELAREHEADMMMLGYAGHGAVERVVMGSTTERLLREAPCPLLVVKTPLNSAA